MTESPSEKTLAKAGEYLLSGRVKVQHLVLLPQGPSFKAHVYSAKQDGDPYHVKFTANGWHCDCPARVQMCAHIIACQAITDFKISTKVEFAHDVDLDKFLEL